MTSSQVQPRSAIAPVAEIRHVIPIPQVEGVMPSFLGSVESAMAHPCAACGQPAQTLALTPFAPDIGELPMHLTCSASLVQLKRLMDRGLPITGTDGAALVRLNAYLDGVRYALEAKR